MIRLERRRTEAIPARFRGAGRIESAAELLRARREYIAANEAKFSYLRSGLWSPAKPQLKAESSGKCGYCESLASPTAHCDVEHIRPKDIYWWLALCFDNYVYSCQICNQSFKRANYPVARALRPPTLTASTTNTRIAAMADAIAPDPRHDDSALPLARFLMQLQREQPDLICPYYEDPEPYFRWRADETALEVEIEPRAARGRPRVRAERTIEILGLNRNDLLTARYHTYLVVNTLCKTHALPETAAVRPSIEETLRSTMADDYAFAAMNRYVIRVIHGLTI